MQTIKQLCLATLVAIFLATGMIAIVDAAGYGGRTMGHGYFTNAGPKSTDFNKVIYGGLTATTNKQAFINEIKSKLSGTDRDKTGAQFIIQTMRGSPTYDHSRPSSADIADWEDRIKDPSVTLVNGDYKFDYNSGFMKNVANDDAFYNDPDTQPAFIFKVNGTIQYVLKISCGNPVGDFDGLPQTSNKWTLSGTSVADRKTARPTQKITWDHTLTNNGPDLTDKSVKYGYRNSLGLGTGHTENRTMAAGSASGTTKSFSSSYTPTLADIGKSLCRSTNAQPRAWNNSGWLLLPTDCVTITAPSWRISATSTANRATAQPGNTITWTHRIRNNGPDATYGNVRYGYKNSEGLGTGSTKPYTLISGAANGTTKSFTSPTTAPNRYNVTQNDVGKNLCRSTIAQPRAGNDSTQVESSPPACVFVPYNYNLTPNVNISPDDVVEPGTEVDVTPSVGNTGPTKSKATQWQLTQIIVQPGRAVPTGGDSNNIPCPDQFRRPGVSCSLISDGTTVFDERGGRLSGDVLTAEKITATDLAVGTKLCFAFSVQPRSSGSGQWRHSTPLDCLVVGKKPKTQIHGGDLSAGKAFSGVSGTLNPAIVKTSTSVKKDLSGVEHTFGSWVEYGVSATGLITGGASGSAYADRDGMASATKCKSSMLSFTNAGSSTCGLATNIGRYATTRSLPDVASSFRIDPLTTPTFDPNASNQQGVYKATGNVTIPGGGSDWTLAKGQWVVINAPDATVTINRNIIYTSDTLQSINDIPQLVIIAKNINISGSVTRVDAWLIATSRTLASDGKINTCSDVAEGADLSSSICNQQLTINGPVMAQKLYLRRTAGSGVGPASGDPAEIFNLRPDAYLWAQARAAGNGRIQTVYTTELPPRL